MLEQRLQEATDRRRAAELFSDEWVAARNEVKALSSELHLQERDRLPAVTAEQLEVADRSKKVMSKYKKLLKILATGHSEAAARAIAAANFGASASGFDALKAEGIASAAPPEGTAVYSWTGFQTNMKRGRKYPFYSDTRFFFNSATGKVAYCGVRKSRFHKTIRVSDDPFHTRWIKECGLNKIRGKGENNVNL